MPSVDPYAFIVKSFPLQPDGILETVSDENLNAPLPDAFVKVVLGVMVKFVAPEQAVVAVTP